jgi:hypothetical protein
MRCTIVGMKLIASMPPETIAWRISKHISVGHFLMENRYDKIQAPTLVIVGNKLGALLMCRLRD